MIVHGTRVEDDSLKDDPFRPGAYGRVYSPKYDRWEWHGVTPNGMLANFVAHDVTEHEDGTITVSPSILCNQGNGIEWHGYLEQGNWRKCQ